MNKKKLINDLEYIRQGYDTVLGLMIPYLPKYRQDVATATCEAYHFFVDKKIVEIGGESVGREYKFVKKKGLFTTDSCYMIERIRENG